MGERFDAVVVGAGIIGLAHAYHLAKRGLSVAVFERNSAASGASIRNFGMLWPIGQPPGEMHRMALRSRDVWLDVLRESGLWHECAGSLFLAYAEDELQILHEFASSAADHGYDCALVTPEEVRGQAPLVQSHNLLGGLASPMEICVDPPAVIPGIADFLRRRYNVSFFFNCAVTQYSAPTLLAGGREWSADRLYLCGGDDLSTLFPEAFQGHNLSRCKLQMLRSEPLASQRLGPMLAAGLTLRHYKAFAGCPTLAAYAERITRELPEFDRFGIHVMASQNGKGELVLGDSHEYDGAITPFDKPEIDELILNYLHTFLDLPDLRIAARWHGIYVKHPTEPYIVLHPTPNATIVGAVGGAGMTLSFGLAETVVAETLA